ncbi:MAG: FecR domain-containing protein [Pseudomonadota bacterium]
MKNALITICTASLLAVLNTSAQGATEIGKAESIDRSVVANNSRQLGNNSAIFSNERLRSNQSGLGHFRFNDGTKMVIGPDSNIVLDENIYNPNQSKFSKFVLKASSGATRFISGSSQSSVYEISTPAGVLGVRGTAFDFRHWRGRTYLMLFEGSVEICSQTGTCRTLRRKCDFVVVEPDGRVSRPTQPRNGIFEARDMEFYFPFVNNQSGLDGDYRLRVNSCAGGAANSGFGGGGDGSSGPSGGDTQ